MKCRKVSSLQDFSDTSDSNGSSPDDTNEAETQIATYRPEQFVLDLNNSFKWWCLNSHKYPKLPSIACKLLYISATFVPYEQLFGNILNKKKMALDPDNVDMLCFLHKKL